MQLENIENDSMDIKKIFMSIWDDITKACDLQYYKCSYCGRISTNLKTLDCPFCKSKGYTHSKIFIKPTDNKIVCKHCGFPGMYDWNTRKYICVGCGVETERRDINNLSSEFNFTTILWYTKGNPEKSFDGLCLYGTRRALRNM